MFILRNQKIKTQRLIKNQKVVYQYICVTLYVNEDMISNLVRYLIATIAKQT